MNKREIVSNMADETVMVMTEDFYDEALVGVVERYGAETVAIYDKQKVIEIIMREFKCDFIEALEHFEYNIIGSFVGEYTPAFLTLIEGSEITWRTGKKYGCVARLVEQCRLMMEKLSSVKSAVLGCPRITRHKIHNKAVVKDANKPRRT